MNCVEMKLGDKEKEEVKNNVVINGLDVENENVNKRLQN